MFDPSQIWERIVHSSKGDLAPEVARYFLSLGFTQAEKDRYQKLSARQHFELTYEEQSELTHLVHANMALMVLQAKARRSLTEQQPAA